MFPFFEMPLSPAGEYPLREVPRFKHLELKELSELLSWEDSSILLDDGDENALTIQDTRPTIHVTPTFHLFWKDISLSLFLPCCLAPEAVDTRHLTHVDLSCNKLPSIPFELFQLPQLESLDVSHNQLTSLPPVELWVSDSHLQYLQASHNMISDDTPPRTIPGQPSSWVLWYVDVSHNLFTSFPRFLLQFSLQHLDISYNTKVSGPGGGGCVHQQLPHLPAPPPQISQLPVELSRMTKLTNLLLQGLTLMDPPYFVVEEGPRAVLHYLRLKLQSHLPWSSLRVVVVGPQHSGKTTLVSKITGTTVDSSKALDVSLPFPCDSHVTVM